MGFLDKLQDFGVGNRGPYGRMKSGATYLTDTIQDRLYVETDKGVNKAIATAAKGGKISPDAQIQIADRWGIPLNEVMKRSKPINDKHESVRLKNMGETFQELVTSWKTANQGTKITDKVAKQLAQKAGAKSFEDMSFLIGGLQKMQPQSEVIKMGQYDSLYSIGKKPIGDDVSVKKLVAGEKRPAGSGDASDFEKAYYQFIKKPGNETIGMAEFKTTHWNKEGGALTDNAVYERLQDHANTIDPETYPIFTAEYEKLRKAGKSRNDALNSVMNDYKSAVSLMPSPEEHEGRVLVDGETGKRYKSDGTNWIPLR